MLHNFSSVQVGLMIASRACYDPGKAVGVWEHLQNPDSGKELEFLSTHPANETRWRSSTEWLALTTISIAYTDALGSHIGPWKWNTLFSAFRFTYTLDLERWNTLFSQYWSNTERQISWILHWPQCLSRTLYKVLSWKCFMQLHSITRTLLQKCPFVFEMSLFQGLYRVDRVFGISGCPDQP